MIHIFLETSCFLQVRFLLLEIGMVDLHKKGRRDSVEVIRVQQRSQVLSGSTLARKDPVADALLPHFPHESAGVMRGVGFFILGFEKRLYITNNYNLQSESSDYWKDSIRRRCLQK